MALTLATLTRVSDGHADTPGLWTYSTEDDITDLDAANYWAGAYARGMRAGAKVYAVCADGPVDIVVSAIAAATSTAAALSTTAQDLVADIGVWVGPIACTGYGTAGRVGSFVSPITGTITKWKHITDTVVTADNTLNLDIGATNATGSIVVEVADTAVDIIDAVAVTADGAVTEGDLVTIESDGAGDTGAGRVWLLIEP